jgi:signal transduction histidine kinase
MNKNMSLKNYSLKFNLTIWYMIILFFVLIFFSSILYFYLEDQLHEEVNNILQMEIEGIENKIKNIDQSNNSYLNNIISSTNKENFKLLFFDSQGNLEAGNLERNSNLEFLAEDIKKMNDFKILEYNDEEWAFMSKDYYITEGEKVGYFGLAYSLAKENNMLNNLMLILFISIPITLILASGGGYFLAKRALNAIDTISSTAEKISQNNMSQRIKISEGRGDEVGRLIKTLNNLLDRLESSFYRQKQFNADVSHELRTPISVIKAQIDESLDLENKLTFDQKDALLTIKKQIDQMNNLISQMLILAKADENSFELDKEEFELNIVVDTVIEEMDNLAIEKDISILKEIEARENFKIKADLSLITQLLLNLIENAIKYTQPSGKIIVRLSKSNDYYQLNIIDNGIGIAEEDISNIFKRFYRVDKSRSREYGGTGLGLAICNWIVNIHDGEIKVNSSLEAGSDFSIILPNN